MIGSASSIFSFREVRIDGNGWLVMHPFKDGRPEGGIYVGATYVEDGDNRDVRITIAPVPEPGDMFIVVLHGDVNENQFSTSSSSTNAIFSTRPSPKARR